MQSNLVLSLPADPHRRAAEVVAFINGQDRTKCALVLESEAENLQTLSDPTSPDSMQAIAAHLPVLESLFHRLSSESVLCKHPTLKVALVRAAMQAQNNYLRTVALLSGLQLQKQGMGSIETGAETWD